MPRQPRKLSRMKTHLLCDIGHAIQNWYDHISDYEEVQPVDSENLRTEKQISTALGMPSTGSWSWRVC